MGITSGINRVLGWAGTHSTPDFWHHSDRQRCCLGATPARGGEQLPGARVWVGGDSPAAAAQTGPAGVRATQTLGFRVVRHIFRPESSSEWKEEVGHRAHPTPARGRPGPLAELSAGAQTRTFRRNVPTLLAAVSSCAQAEVQSPMSKVQSPKSAGRSASRGHWPLPVVFRASSILSSSGLWGWPAARAFW